MNAINESLERMLKAEEVIEKENKVVDTKMQKLLREAIEQVNTKNCRTSHDITVAYQRALQEAIEKVNPDKCWHEITNCDIYNTLLECKNDTDAVICRILAESKVQPKQKTNTSTSNRKTLNEGKSDAKKASKKLTEAPNYELHPQYDSRQSFYGKARVDTGDNNDRNRLYSYDTLVAEIKNGKPIVYGTYSATTLRHIKDWLKQNGFKAETSSQIMRDYGVKTESCKGRKSGKKNLKETYENYEDVNTLAKAIDDAYDELLATQNEGGCYTFKLDNGLAVCVGWESGFDPKTTPTGDEWDIVAGIKVWTSDDLRTDYEWINAPYYKDGEVWDTTRTLGKGDGMEIAKYLLKEYDAMKDLYITEDGEILDLPDEVSYSISEFPDDVDFDAYWDDNLAGDITGKLQNDYGAYASSFDYDVEGDTVTVSYIEWELDESCKGKKCGKKLAEDTPADLRNKIKGFQNQQNYRVTGNNIDFNASNAVEITGDELLRAKKAGEDLSDVYIKIGGDFVKLNKDGKVVNDSNTLGRNTATRANAGLKSLIDQASKIYRFDSKRARETHPERFSGDEEERRANLFQGAARQKDYGLGRWEYGAEKNYNKRKGKIGDKIHQLRQDWRKGDLAYNEMERKIAGLKDQTPRYGYSAKQDSKQKAADRFYASNKKLQEPIKRLNQLKDELGHLEYFITNRKDDLATAKKLGGYEFGQGYNKVRIEEIQKQIEELQRQLDRYTKQFDAEKGQKEIDKIQAEIDRKEQEVVNVKNELNKLLKRPATESLKRKKLKEADQEVYVFEQIPPEDTFVDFKDFIGDYCYDLGIVIIGNRDFIPFGDKELISIINGDYEDEDLWNEENGWYDEYDVFEELKKVTGKDYAKGTIRGYTQGDWQTVYYPVNEERYLDDIETYYFGKFDEYVDEGCSYIVPHDISWKGTQAIKKELADQSGIPADKIRLRKFTGYHKVADYEEESLKESRYNDKLSVKRWRDIIIYGVDDSGMTLASMERIAKIKAKETGNNQVIYLDPDGHFYWHTTYAPVNNWTKQESGVIPIEIVIVDESGNTTIKKDPRVQKILDDKDVERRIFGDKEESLKEDTVKQGTQWVNKGKEGTHGKFKTKKAADAQRKAMFANGYKGEACKESFVKKVQEALKKSSNRKLNESAYSDGVDAYWDLVERAKLWIDECDEDADLTELVQGALDDGLIYTDDIIGLAAKYGVIDTDQLVNDFYEELFNDIYSEVSDYFDDRIEELQAEAEEDEEDEDEEETEEESLKK